MARKYSRDNRGRFASVGATARGGRLNTATGNKRATVTERLKGPSGRLAKPKGLKPQQGAASAASSGKRVSFRSRSDAAMAQAKRSRGTIEATRFQVLGQRRGVTALAGGGQRISVKRAMVKQGNLLGGTDKVAVPKVKAVATNKGPAPSSKAARRQQGIARRSGEGGDQKLKKVWARAVGIGMPGKQVPGIVERRAKRDPYGMNPKRRKQSFQTAQKAARYIDSRRRSMPR